MSDPTHTVTVKIAGESHTLRSGVSPEHTREVAAYLDNTVRRMGVPAAMEPHRAVLLAAMTVTDELFRARRELEELRSEVSSRAEAVAGRLDAGTRNASEGE